MSFNFGAIKFFFRPCVLTLKQLYHKTPSMSIGKSKKEEKTGRKGKWLTLFGEAACALTERVLYFSTGQFAQSVETQRTSVALIVRIAPAGIEAKGL